MAEVTIELTDDEVGAIMWAAARDPEKPMSVEEYISFVMSSAAQSYAKQAETEEVQTLGRAALSDAKARGAVLSGR